MVDSEFAGPDAPGQNHSVSDHFIWPKRTAVWLTKILPIGTETKERIYAILLAIVSFFNNIIENPA